MLWKVAIFIACLWAFSPAAQADDCAAGATTEVVDNDLVSFLQVRTLQLEKAAPAVASGRAVAGLATKVEVAASAVNGTHSHVDDLVFLHIPKNAGVSIIHTGRQYGLNWDSVPKCLNPSCLYYLQDGSACAPAHTPPYLLPPPLAAHNPYAGNNTFCVKREPYGRLVSVANYLTHGWGIEVGLGYNFSSTLPDCTAAWLNDVVQKMLIAQQTNPYVGNCFLVPQADLIWGLSGHQWCEHIIAIENLTEEFDQLMADFGREDIHISSHGDHCSECCEGLSANLFTDETRQMIAIAFSDDFVRLGYPM